MNIYFSSIIQVQEIDLHTIFQVFQKLKKIRKDQLNLNNKFILYLFIQYFFMNEISISNNKKYHMEKNNYPINSTESVIKLLRVVQNNHDTTISQNNLTTQLNNHQTFNTNLFNSFFIHNNIYNKSQFKNKIPIHTNHQQIKSLPPIKKSHPYNLFKLGLEGHPLIDPKRKNLILPESPILPLQKQKSQVKLQSIRSRNNIHNMNEFEDSLDLKILQSENRYDRRRIHTELQNHTIVNSGVMKQKKQRKQKKQKEITKLQKILLTKITEKELSKNNSSKNNYYEGWQQQQQNYKDDWDYTINNAMGKE